MNSTLSYSLFCIAAAVATLLCASVSSAAPMYTTYQAKIIKPDGHPLEATSVNFRFTILDPAGACILYSENFNTINMSGTAGLVYFSLGSGIKTYPTSGTVDFSDVFNNQVSSLSCDASGPVSYTPTANDLRKIVMQFHDGTGWQTLPAMNINHVPYAMYAKNAASATTAVNSLQLNGKTDLDFVQVTSIPTCGASQALQFNGASFGCVTVGSGGGGLLSVSGTAPIMVTGSASAPVISISVASMSSDGYLTSADYAEFKAKLSASSTQIVNTLGYAPVSSSAVATQIASTNLSGDVSGTISSNSVMSVGGKAASQISTSVDNTLAATSSNTTNTIVKRDSSGNFTANDIYANAAKINYFDIYKPSTSFNIRLQAPTSLSANYSLVFPDNAGIGGQVLTTDGSGNLSWTSQTTTITSSDVITALGYTPANSATIVSSQWSTSGTTINYMTGNVGIGTATPGAMLEIAGQVKITGGTPGAGKILTSDASGLATWETPAAGNPGTVISVTSANSYLSIINTTSTPVITANIGTVSNTLAAGDDARFTDSRPPAGNAGGDLSGTYPNPTVAKINGNAVASTTPVTGQVMRWTGSQYAPVNFSIGHLLSATGAQQFANSSCSASQTLTWSSLTDTFTCANIAGLDAGVITTGTINAARLPAQPFVIGGTFVGVLANSQVLTQFPFPINVTIPANCTNSRFEFLTAATASTTISLQKCTGTGFTSCTQFGTATISASGKVASFTCASATSFTAGTDSLVVLGPAIADATAATAGWAIYGTR